MKPIYALDKFPDGRVMLKILFFRNSNFWIHNMEQASWVPTLEEANFLKEALDIVNERNEIRRIAGSSNKPKGA